MMWNTLTIIKPELVPVIIGLLYLAAVVVIRKISVSNIILAVLILTSLAPINIITYAYVLSAVYIAQALILMDKKEKTVAYKYFILAFMATTICLDPVLPHYKIALLIIALIQSLFTSEKTESQNTYLYIANLTLLTSLVLKLQPIYEPNLSSSMVIITLSIMCVRILILNTTTILTILPLFILGTVFSEKTILVSIFIYSIYLAILVDSQKHKLAVLILLLLPFIDFGIFSISFKDMLNNSKSLDPLYTSIVLAVLLSMCVAKALETDFKKSRLSFSYKTILLSVFPALLIVIKPIETGVAKSSLPIPLMVAIPLIIVEAKYLSLFSKINLKLNFKIPKAIGYSFRWLNTLPKIIRTKRTTLWIKATMNHIDKKTLEQDYTTLLAAITLIASAIVFLYMEIL